MRLVKPFLIVCFTLLLSKLSLAQKETLFLLDTSYSIPHASSYSAAKVIDLRKDQTNIGFIETGTFNRISRLVTALPLAETMEQYSIHLLRSSLKEKDTLLIILHDFSIDMDAKTDIAGSFYMNADFFLGSHNAYKLLGRVDTMLEEAGKDLVNQLQILANDQFVYQLDRMALKSTLHSTANSLTISEAAYYFDSLKKAYPIYNVQKYKKGVYLTYQDFLHHYPSDTPFIQKDMQVDNVNKPHFYYENSKGRKGERIEHAFAIYTGKVWYRFTKDGWKRFYFENGDFYGRMTRKGIKTSAGAGGTAATVAGGLMFGVVGAIVVSSIADANGTKESEGVCDYEAKLNPETGKFQPIRRL